ncbi:hypothetical protein [Micromonospora profundi]|uniref:hypothetical protein n=1 Tax=Micromonospora profundi TaxID=1420889 RepID=UPI003668BB5F
MTAAVRSDARYECGGPCANCSEPIVRLLRAGQDPSRWLHTPNRLPCIDHLTREVRDTVAEQRQPVLARADIPAARSRGAR